jgi:hypothetical protein
LNSLSATALVIPFVALQVCDSAGYSEGFSVTSGVRRNLARAIPLLLQHAAKVFREDVKTFHCVDCRWRVMPMDFCAGHACLMRFDAQCC